MSNINLLNVSITNHVDSLQQNYKKQSNSTYSVIYYMPSFRYLKIVFKMKLPCFHTLSAILIIFY